MGRDDEKKINGSEREVGASWMMNLSHSFNALGTTETRNESIPPRCFSGASLQ